MPPPPTTPATAEYERKLIASTVRPSTSPERASTSNTRRTTCHSDAPIVCCLEHDARHLAQALFDQPREIRDRRQRERHRGRQRADRGAGNHAA